MYDFQLEFSVSNVIYLEYCYIDKFLYFAIFNKDKSDGTTSMEMNNLVFYAVSSLCVVKLSDDAST